MEAEAPQRSSENNSNGGSLCPSNAIQQMGEDVGNRKRARVDDSQIRNPQTGHGLLLSIHDVGRIYISGCFSRSLTSMIEGAALTPVFGYDLNFPSADEAKTGIGDVKTVVGTLIMSILMDASHMRHNVAGKLLHRLMFGTTPEAGKEATVVSSKSCPPCLESEALSDGRYGDMVGIGAKALATKFQESFPGEDKYPCVVEDLPFVLGKIGSHRRDDLVAVPRRVMNVLKRGGYLDLKRTDVGLWYKKASCYKTLAAASEDADDTKVETILCDAGMCSLVNRWSSLKEKKPATTANGDTNQIVVYIKAGPGDEGASAVGDCPYGQYVRIVLEEKGVEYELKPCTLYNKPQWLVQQHGGALPALSHRDEQYSESEICAQYIDFFFSQSSLTPYDMDQIRVGKEASSGIFPALARYLTHLPDHDDEAEKHRGDLEKALGRLEQHFASRSLKSGPLGPYLVGDGTSFSLLDASLAPKLYHMHIGLQWFKDLTTKDMSVRFPHVYRYMKAVFTRPSVKQTLPKSSVIVWGWTNARGSKE